MKKIFIFIIIIITICIYSNCATSKVNHVFYYRGYIYTKEREPIHNITIHPERIKDSVGITDENGYVKFEMPTNGYSMYLEVELEGKIIDTIQFLRLGPHGRHSYFFLRETDTVFIDLARKKKMATTMKNDREPTADSQQWADTPADVTLDDIDMVYVEGGTFTMGCTAEQGEDCRENEKPAHNVTVSSFYLGRYEVTQRLWMAVMESNPSYFKGDHLPVEMVTWNGWNAVQTFIERLNEKTGKKYRLPTEAEWEYAARGGSKSKGYKYSGSNDINDVAWCDADNTHSSALKTHPVGIKQPNELKIYDMSGNVCEWVSDWYGDYHSSNQMNPTGPSSGSTRVLRGGLGHRVSQRSYGNPAGRSTYSGFRLAHDAD